MSWRGELPLYVQTIRRFSSVLYLTGDKAQQTFAVLIPYINFEEQLHNKSSLVSNIKARKVQIDFGAIEKKWHFFKDIDKRKKILEKTRSEIHDSIQELVKNPNENQAEINKLKLHSRLVKDELKNLKDNCYEVEENVMLQILDLPNDLHQKTPLESEVVLYEHLEKPQVKSKTHMEIAESNNFIHYVNPMCCYLRSDAALFEMALLNYFRNSLKNFTQFSNPDFVRSVVVEGCGVDFTDSSKVFTLESTHEEKSTSLHRLHLVGGASLYSFMAYFTKLSIPVANFPLKLFAIGRNYQPVPNSPTNLFNLSQQSALNIFVVTHANEQELLDEIFESVKSIYQGFGWHFKLVFIPASKLDKSESLRLSIQMFSNYLQEYVEVGNVSFYDSYLSKRLLVNYSVDKQRQFPKIIAGTLLNVHKVLGCVLENNSLSNRDLLCSLLTKNLYT